MRGAWPVLVVLLLAVPQVSLADEQADDAVVTWTVSPWGDLSGPTVIDAGAIVRFVKSHDYAAHIATDTGETVCRLAATDHSCDWQPLNIGALEAVIDLSDPLQCLGWLSEHPTSWRPGYCGVAGGLRGDWRALLPTPSGMDIQIGASNRDTPPLPAGGRLVLPLLERGTWFEVEGPGGGTWCPKAAAPSLCVRDLDEPGHYRFFTLTGEREVWHTGSYGQVTVAGSAPTLTVLEPQPGDMVAGIITVRAAATAGAGLGTLTAQMSRGYSAAFTSGPADAWSLTWDTRYTPPGAYLLQVQASSHDGQQHVATVPVTIANPALPDLSGYYSGEGAAQPHCLATGTDVADCLLDGGVRHTLGIWNGGTAAAAATVRGEYLHRGEWHVFDEAAGNFPVNDVSAVNLTWSEPFVMGDVPLRFLIDPDNTVPEIDETNNIVWARQGSTAVVLRPDLGEATTTPPASLGDGDHDGLIAAVGSGNATCHWDPCIAIGGESADGTIAISDNDAHGTFLSVTRRDDGAQACSGTTCATVGPDDLAPIVQWLDELANATEDPPESHLERVAVNATGDARCRGDADCVAISGTGNASGRIALSGTGDARGGIAVSGAGDAVSDCAARASTDVPCIAASGTGDAWGEGEACRTYTGYGPRNQDGAPDDYRWRRCEHSTDYAVSGTGNASGDVAVAGTGDATNCRTTGYDECYTGELTLSLLGCDEQLCAWSGSADGAAAVVEEYVGGWPRLTPAAATPPVGEAGPGDSWQRHLCRFTGLCW